MKRQNIKDRDVKTKSIDVSPLDKRESKINIRKGIERKQETVNIHFLEQDQKLF